MSALSNKASVFSHPPFTTVLLYHKGHVRLNRHVLLEFRTGLTPQEGHESCMTRSIDWGHEPFQHEH